MTALVLLILGAVWAAVLVPPALRARAEASPGDTIGTFNHQLNILRRTGGYRPIPVQGEFGSIPLPGDPEALRAEAVRKRRRDVLVTLLWVMGGTLLLGLIPTFRALLLLHVVADLLFAAYVGLLLHYKRQAEEAKARIRRAEERAKVTRLHRESPKVTDLALRRAAGN